MERLIEKVILTGTNVVSSTDSDEVDLNHAKGFCVISQITSSPASAKTFDSGVQQIDVLTCPAKAAAGDGDYCVVYDMAGDPWAIAFDLTGSSPAPTGAIWTAIPSGQKAQVDISGATDAASVGVIVTAGFSGLTGFSAVITITDNLDGTIDFERVDFGIPTASTDKNADDSGTGTMSWAIGTAGVVAEVNVSTNVLSIPTHGFTLGVKGQLTSTGTLPSGFSLLTDYYVIYVSAGEIKLASSYANAVAGTAVLVIDNGTGVHTFTPTATGGAIKLQGRLLNSSTYVDVASSSVSITGTQNNMWNIIDPQYRFVKVNVTPTGGRLNVSAEICVNGEVE